MPAQIATTEDLAALHAEIRAIRQMLEGATVIPAPEWVSIKEAARRMNVKPETIRNRIARGEMEARGAGRMREVKV